MARKAGPELTAETEPRATTAKSVTPGAQGPSGAAGAPGANGANGANGKDGGGGILGIRGRRPRNAASVIVYYPLSPFRGSQTVHR